MSSQKKTNKVTTSHKITTGAVSVIGIVGGWNIIGNMEKTASAENIIVEEDLDLAPTAVPPSPTPWPAIQPLAEIPRLQIKPLPTLAVGGPAGAVQDAPVQIAQDPDDSFGLSTMPSAAPLPTLAPLPTVPEYVPPPPPPPSKASSNGGGGGGNTSKGS